MTDSVGASFAQAAFRDQIARLARIDQEAQEKAVERLTNVFPLPWDDDFKTRIGKELALRESEFTHARNAAFAKASDSNFLLVGGSSPRLNAIRSLAHDVEAGEWR